MHFQVSLKARLSRVPQMVPCGFGIWKVLSALNGAMYTQRYVEAPFVESGLLDILISFLGNVENPLH